MSIELRFSDKKVKPQKIQCSFSCEVNIFGDKLKNISIPEDLYLNHITEKEKEQLESNLFDCAKSEIKKIIKSIGNNDPVDLLKGN